MTAQHKCKFCHREGLGEIELKTPGVLFHYVGLDEDKVQVAPVRGTALFFCRFCVSYSQFFIEGERHMVHENRLKELMESEELLDGIKELLWKEES